MSVHSLCGVLKALYKSPQKTGTEVLSRYSLEYGMSGQIVDQKCSVLFLCFFLAVSEKCEMLAEGRGSLCDAMNGS